MPAPLEPSPDESTAQTARGYRSTALALMTLALIALCVILLLPFLPALAWGVALAVIAWPLQTRMLRHIPNRLLATGLTTIAVLLVIVIPGLFVAYHLTVEATGTAQRFHGRQSETVVRDTLFGSPAAREVVVRLEQAGVNVDREVRRIVEANTRDLSALVQGSLMGLVQFAVAMFILFHLLADRDTLLIRVRALLPMTRDETNQVVETAANSINANLYANFVTSVIDGVGGGLVFYFAGLPSPVTWGAVMFFLSFIPMFGTWIAWAPAAVYLFLVGETGAAFTVIVWGLISMFIVGNVIYTMLAGRGMRLHPVPTLLAFLGGLTVFGVSGIILGPGIVAVTVAVLDVWHRRANGTAATAPPPSAAVTPAPDSELRRRPEVVPTY